MLPKDHNCRNIIGRTPCLRAGDTGAIWVVGSACSLPDAYDPLKDGKRGTWVLSSLVPPSAQGLILETRDRVPRQAPCMGPTSPSASLSFLSVFLVNK